MPSSDWQFRQHSFEASHLRGLVLCASHTGYRTGAALTDNGHPLHEKHNNYATGNLALHFATTPFKQLPLHSPWKTILLDEPGTAQHSDELAPLAKLHGQAFLDSHPELFEPLSGSQSFVLDHWYASTEGQETLAAIARKLWKQMASHADYAMPAHDARHAMFKVPATAVQYAAAENVTGWERVGFLGALLHDHGRWAEERVLGGPGESVLHARLSFLLGEEAMREFEMPELIRQHILLSALRHTTGAVDTDPMPLKLTVAADREQLYGPEIVLRLTHHVPMVNGGLGSYYPRAEFPTARSVIPDLARLLVDRLPGPLYERQAEMEQLWQVSCNFVIAAEGEDQSRERFEQVLKQDTRSMVPTSFNWEATWRRFHVESASQWDLPPGTTPTDSLLELILAPNTAPSKAYLQVAVDKFEVLEPEQQLRIARGLRYVNAERIRMDAEQAADLRGIAVEADLLTRTIIGLVMPGLREKLCLKPDGRCSRPAVPTS